jgi:hypothetical protein
MCSGTEGMSGHVRRGRGLTRCASRRCRGRRLRVLSWDATIESTADPLPNAQLAAGESSCSGYQIPRATIVRSLRLEQHQDMLCTVCRPRCDGPPVSFAECLWGGHTSMLSVPGAPHPGERSAIGAPVPRPTPQREVGCPRDRQGGAASQGSSHATST